MIQPSPQPDEAVTLAKALILQAVQQMHMGLEEATRYVGETMRVSPELLHAAFQLLDDARKGNTAMGMAVTNQSTYAGGDWYLGAVRGGHWERYYDLLRSRSTPGLDSLDNETRHIVSLLADPNRQGATRKGLVMGNVQSGKTRNFAGVVAKAVDAGYRVVIVLSGMYNNLRSQTQTRLDSQLFEGEGWYPLTDAESDFEPVLRPQELLLHQPAVCAVVKKNPARLSKLVRMMRDVPVEVRRIRPVLIIDDEADQATPNSLAAKKKISAINRHMRNLWATVPTGTYVAYTATPFANVLMDPDVEEELFPSDFITTIEPGQGYFGAERLFGIADTVGDDGCDTNPGLDMVRSVPSYDAGQLRPPSDAAVRAAFDPDLPSSLVDAFTWFVVATAIRKARRQQAHSSMLVHTTHYTAPHYAMRRRIERLIQKDLAKVRGGEFGRFHAAWKAESRRAATEATVALPTWEEIRDWIPLVLGEAEVIVDNGSSDDRLNYEDGKWRTVVAVGGGTLSRGLTLEGLVVSYFTRTTNTYDTLMQMGRWFGYRPGYEDLPRVWVTDGLDKDYAFLAGVERDLRAEIQSVQGSEFTPAQVGVKVRAHPGRLQITAANKMFSAQVVQLGLSGTANQTFILDASSRSTIEKNVAAAETLISGRELHPIPWAQDRYLANGVAGGRVCAFINSFRVHEDQAWLADAENRERMTEWVSKWASGSVWNVVLFGNSADLATDRKTLLGTVSVGGVRLRCVNRSAMLGSTPARVDLKAIMSPDDRLCDIPPSLYEAQPHGTDADRRRIRRLLGGGNGLIVIYPISANSKAGARSRDRMDMPVDFHQLGFSVFFPNINDTGGREGAFVSVRRTWEVPDTVEGDDPNAEDEEDPQDG